jgi:hypothetical protein
MTVRFWVLEWLRASQHALWQLEMLVEDAWR